MMDVEDTFKKLSFGAIFKKPEKLAQTMQNESLNSQKMFASPFTGNDQLTSTVKRDSTNLKLIENEHINQIRNANKIKVSGKNIPSPIQSFDELRKIYNLSSQIVQNITESGYNKPTPVQMQAIPIMLKGKQILTCAPTGSGKTAAFLIPIIHQLRRPKNCGFRAVIVSPTRELSRQTYRECERLCEKLNLRIHITTKIKDTVKKSASSNKSDILITTPNRLVFLLNQEPPTISLKNVEWLIVDESDKLFETGVRGFRDQLAVIYQACDSKNVKRAMFSATYTPEVAKWCRKNLKNLALVTIGHRNTTVESVDQELIYVGNEEGKLIEIRNLIRKGVLPPVLVFVQSKERARQLCNELLYDGVNVDVIHADRPQLQRDTVVQEFREGKVWVLICTELMGRGIDFKGVNLVINYDFPLTSISYIHRIGRTGRAGRRGKAVTLYTDDDLPYVKSIINVMKESGCKVPESLKSIKKPHKKVLKKLKSNLSARGNISQKPHRYKRLKDMVSTKK